MIGCCIHYKQVQQGLGEVRSNKPKRKRHRVRRHSTRSPPASSLCSPPLSPSPSSSMSGSLARSRGSRRVSPLRFRADSFRMPVSHPSLNYRFVVPQEQEQEDNTYLLDRFLEDSVSEAEPQPQPQSQPTPPASPLATFSSPTTPSTVSVSVSSSSPTPQPASKEVYSEPAIALNIPSSVPSRAAVTSTSKRDKVKLMVDRKKRWHIRRELASTLFRTA